jgi:hypothetical protein
MNDHLQKRNKKQENITNEMVTKENNCERMRKIIPVTSNNRKGWTMNTKQCETDLKWLTREQTIKRKWGWSINETE